MKKHASILSLLLTGAMLVGSFPTVASASQPSDFGLETAYQIAAEGTVLLKNEEGALPLEKGSKLNVFGLTQVQTFLGGSGSGSGSIENPVFLTDALRAEGFEVNEDLYNAYEAYWNDDAHWIEEEGWFGPVRKSTLRRCIDVVDGVGLGQAFSEYVIGYEEMPLSEEQIAQAKEFSDTAVVIISRSGSEGADLAESDMRLYDDEAALLEQVATNFSQVVVLLNTATNLEMGFLEDYPSIKAAALIWAPGIRGCEAVADILSGDVNPSGKLADSAAYSIKDYPSNENFGVFYEDDGFTRYLEYEEDIYVGYRYFATFDKPVQFPFGYGLSYTTFDLDAEGVAEDEEHVSLTVTVTNTGDVAGKEVVQAYVSAPDGILEKPAIELAAFAKTQSLEPGEAQTMTLTWKKRDMASYSEESSAYLLEAGEYKILVGNSSQNLGEAGVVEVAETITYDTDATTGTAYQNLFTSERTDSLVKLSKLDESTYPTMPETGVLTASAEEETVEEEAVEEEEVAEEPAEEAVEEVAEEEPAEEAVEEVAEEEPAEEAVEEEVPAEEAAPETAEITLADVYADESLWGDFLAQFSDEELILYLMNGEFKTLTMDKYGIPRMDMKDGPANVQAGTGGWGGDIGTTFPVAVMIACTWNTELARDYGTASGMEAKAFVGPEGEEQGTEVWYAPALNLHRNPRCGRNFEYYSEDPVLSGSIAAAATIGAQSEGLVVTLKHFAVNNQETGRVGVNTYLSERAIRELYLKSFEIPVKAGALGVMSAFDYIGTTWCSANKALLVDLLRNEWGFDGFVITDAYMDVTAEKWPQTEQLIYAENNLFLSSQDSATEGRYLAEYETIAKELEENPEFRAQLEENVKQVLSVLMRTYAFSPVIGSEENVSFAPKEALFTVE